MILIICASPGLADTGEMEFASNGIFCLRSRVEGLRKNLFYAEPIRIGNTEAQRTQRGTSAGRAFKPISTLGGG
jgi:hypothetical protein